MPHLYIRYGDIVLHDGDVDEMTYTDATGSVAVTAAKATQRQPKPAGGGGANALLDLLAGARRQQTAAMVERRRAELHDDGEDQAAERPDEPAAVETVEDTIEETA